MESFHAAFTTAVIKSGQDMAIPNWNSLSKPGPCHTVLGRRLDQVMEKHLGCRVFEAVALSSVTSGEQTARDVISFIKQGASDLHAVPARDLQAQGGSIEKAAVFDWMGTRVLVLKEKTADRDVQWSVFAPAMMPQCVATKDLEPELAAIRP